LKRPLLSSNLYLRRLFFGVSITQTHSHVLRFSWGESAEAFAMFLVRLVVRYRIAELIARYGAMRRAL